jgi:MFS family permease
MSYIPGSGMGLSFAPSIIVLSQYFEKRRALANGLAVAGSGVGNFVIPSLYRYLIDQYGLRGCLIIYGGITLNICVCGALFRPVDDAPPSKDLPLDEVEVSVEEDSYCDDRSIDSQSSVPSWAEANSEILDHYAPEADDWPEEDCCGCKQCFTCLCFMPSPDPQLQRGRPLFDVSLLASSLFHVYFWAVFMASIGHSSVFVMLPHSAIERGLSKEEAALLVSIIGAADLVGRVVFGWVSDLQLMQRKHGFFLTMALAGAVAMLLPITSSSFKYQAPVCAVFGLFGGSFIALTAVVLAEALGTARLPNAFGLTVLGQGIGMLIAFPGMGQLNPCSHKMNSIIRLL